MNAPRDAIAPIAALATLHPAFDAQQATALAWRTSTVEQRRQRLQALRRRIVHHQDAVLQALRDDLGKPDPEARITELVPVYDEIAAAIRHLPRWTKAQRVAPTLAMMGTRSRLRPEPRGRSLILSPWNYPFSLAIGPLVSALAAGCPAILKPSEFTPATSAVIARIVREAFRPDEVTVFEGGIEVASALLDLPFDHVFFTGSTGVGRIVMTAAAKHLASVTLELGGKSPTIVDGTADLDEAARVIAWGKFTNAGQTCVAPDHVFVHRAVHDVFVGKLKGAIGELYGADDAAVRAGGSYGRIVSPRHAERLQRLLDGARAAGARVLHGGTVDTAARYMAPTVIGVPPGPARSGPWMDEEIFGPLLPVMAYDDLDTVLADASRGAKPLALYLFSRDRAAIDKVTAVTTSGGLCINHAIVQFAHGGLPFGGVGASGQGQAHGEFGFRAFSHFKPVVENRFLTAKLLFPPYDARKAGWIRRMVDFTAGR